VVLYAILIFVISSIPYLSITSSRFELLDKFYHFIEFGVLSFLLFLAFFKSEVKLLNTKPQLFSTFFGVGYAFSDEVHQYFVPGRSADIFDFVADCIGVILVQVILWFYLKSKSQT
jgi:VanZ family protein